MNVGEMEYLNQTVSILRIDAFNVSCLFCNREWAKETEATSSEETVLE